MRNTQTDFPVLTRAAAKRADAGHIVFEHRCASGGRGVASECISGDNTGAYRGKAKGAETKADADANIRENQTRRRPRRKQPVLQSGSVIRFRRLQICAVELNTETFNWCSDKSGRCVLEEC